MILIIDATDKICQVGLYDGKNLDIKKWRWQKDTGTEVLNNVEKLLKRHRATLKNIQAILVNRGPGSFTGTRVGITIANSLGFSLNIPAFGYSKGKLSLKNQPSPIYE